MFEKFLFEKLGGQEHTKRNVSHIRLDYDSITDSTFLNIHKVGVPQKWCFICIALNVARVSGATYTYRRD